MVALYISGQHKQVHRYHPQWEYIILNFDEVKVPLLVTIFLLVAGGMKTIFHLSGKLIKIVPESCLLVILGETLFMNKHMFLICEKYVIESLRMCPI